MKMLKILGFIKKALTLDLKKIHETGNHFLT